MKGNKKVLVAIVLLLLISVTFTTLAIYRTTATAEGTVNAAAWKVKVNGTEVSTATLTATFTPATTNVGMNGKMAPGDKATATFTVDATESEVPIIVDSATVVDGTVPEGFEATVGEVTYDGTQKATVTVELTWTGDANDGPDKDTADIAKQGTTISGVQVQLTVRQKLASDNS